MQVCLPWKLLSDRAFLPLCIQVAKAVSHSLNNCVNCLPGQKDVDVALKSIGESSKKLLVDSVRGFGSGRGTWRPGLTSGAGGVFSPPGTLWVARLPLGVGFPAYLPFPCFAFQSAEFPGRVSKIYFFLEPTLPFDLGLSLWAKNGAGYWRGRFGSSDLSSRHFRPWQSGDKGMQVSGTHWKSEWSVEFHCGACSLLFL